MIDSISKASVCEILADMYPTDGERVIPVKEIDKAYEAIQQLPSVQTEYYDISDIDELWEYYTKEHDLNLTENARQIKEALWLGYRKGKEEKPEIIHCKDCKYWVGHCCYERNRIRIGLFTHGTDYCSWTERRTK